MFVDCNRRALPYISERGANNSGPNAGHLRTSVMGVAGVIYRIPYARTNMETVSTISTELLIWNSAAILGAAGAVIADATGLRKV